MTVFSTSAQLRRIATLASKFMALPFANDSVPGAVLEAILAEVRDATVLKTYDFIDVVKAHQGIGWQVKSTLESTPVTWKRAKIPDKEALIAASRRSAKGVQQLGDAVIECCNKHAVESLNNYGLDQIGYARLLVRRGGKALYFERTLVTKAAPQLFDPKQFEWKWSKSKKALKKEQLSALHGIHVESGRKWWAWHGLGENQLHFSGETEWWPQDMAHAVEFTLPLALDRMSMQDLIELLDGVAIELPVDGTDNRGGQ